MKRASIPVDKRTRTFEDKKSKARTAAFTFDFPDGYKGIVMITKLAKTGWEPGEQIENIHIDFK